MTVNFELQLLAGQRLPVNPVLITRVVDFVFKPAPATRILLHPLPLSDKMPGDLSKVVGFTLPDRPVRSLKLYEMYVSCLGSSTP